MTMGRSIARSWAGLAGLALLGSGCGGFDPFAPPSRTRTPAPSADSASSAPSSSSTSAPLSKANFLVFVVPGVPSPEVETWARRAQTEANARRAIFRLMGPGPGQPASEQTTFVRRALADGASALIVYPGDAPDLPQALAEAEAKGVPVILIDKALAGPAGARPFTLVEPQPFEASARRIVETMMDDLKKAVQPANGTAFVLVDQETDARTSARVAALKAAALAAKFREVIEIPIVGSDEPSSKQKLAEAIKAHPDVSIVLADDAEGLMAGAMTRVEAKGKPIFFVGGFGDYRPSAVTRPPMRESCYVEGRWTELGGLAVDTALARLAGEPVGEHAYLIPRFVRAGGEVATESSNEEDIKPRVRRSDSLGDLDKPKKP